LNALMKTLLLAATALVGISASQLRAGDAWELSITGGWRQLGAKLQTQGTHSFDTTPLNTSSKSTVFYPGIDLRRDLGQAAGAMWRLGIGYNYSKESWDTGEHVAGEKEDVPGGEIYTLDITNFDVKSHQITLMLDAAWKLGNSWEVGLRAGPTLTFFDGTFTGSHESFQEVSEGNGQYLGGRQRAESGTKVAGGVSGEVFVRYNVPSTKVFLEVRGGGAWTSDVKFGDSAISAKANATSWTAGVAVGLKF